ncbi:MAG: 3'-5' exonuclease [Candidatus Moraniibacteriota bacterium]|nr:MAG: 3'-5' exonuclease [Candidatus Moranbacteria bacterium]
MPTLIFDIETVGEDFSALDETTKESLTRWIRRESNDDEAYQVALRDLEDGLGFSPLTGQIVAIGVLDAERKKSAVYYQPANASDTDFEEDDCKFEALSEKAMLAKFWDIATKYDTFVTFNGRQFDVPFLMVRSAIHGVKPSKNLLANRYLSYQPWNAKHVDLLDQLSFYGAMRRKGSLHLWTRAFGIESPKAQGVTGDDVRGLFKEGRYKEIARYNARDLVATLALYDRYQTYLVFPEK